jgi:carbon-monoxide dehydrogenase large subunit
MSFLDSREASAASGIGKSVPRREDARLLTGRGQYAADFNLPGQAFAYVLRSPHAHAKIVDIDLASATGARGALAVRNRRGSRRDRPDPAQPGAGQSA